MERNKGLWLEWFCKFVQEDLPELPIHERIKLGLEINWILSGADRPERPGRMTFDHLAPKALSDLVDVSDTRSQNLESFQEALKPVFSDIMTKIERLVDFVASDPKHVPFKETPFDLDNEAHLADFKADVQLALVADWGYPKNQGTTFIGGVGAMADFATVSIDSALLDRASIRFVYQYASPAQYLLFRLHQAMDGAPLKAFRKCPECGKWFVHLSKREKQFCSNRCASRYGIREKRKEAKRTSGEERRGQDEIAN